MAFERLQERWEQITSRERMLVAALGALLIIGLTTFFAVSIQKRLHALTAKNETTRLALDALAKHREALSQQGPEEMRAQITPTSTKLDSYLDAIINELKLQAPAYPSEKENKKGEFVEMTMDVRMPKPLTVAELSSLLEKIETRDPKVVVRDLNIRRNFTDKSKLDVTMVIATYKKAAPGKDDKDKSGKQGS